MYIDTCIYIYLCIYGTLARTSVQDRAAHQIIVHGTPFMQFYVYIYIYIYMYRDIYIYSVLLYYTLSLKLIIINSFKTTDCAASQIIVHGNPRANHNSIINYIM